MTSESRGRNLDLAGLVLAILGAALPIGSVSGQGAAPRCEPYDSIRGLRGFVVIQRDSTPISGAQLLWADTGCGAVADSDGRFRLAPPIGRSTLPDLLVSSIGFASVRISDLTPGREIVVPLEEIAIKLDNLCVPAEMAFLRIIPVDSLTGEALGARATGRVWRTDHWEDLIRVDTILTTPSSERRSPFEVEVSSPGYTTWHGMVRATIARGCGSTDRPVLVPLRRSGARPATAKAPPSGGPPGLTLGDS
jgi:hypothetical protein